jgi:ammonia channel protein AmtB
MAGLIYPFVAYWAWEPGGWMNIRGYHDFAGSGVVHCVGGVVALIACYLLEPRYRRFKKVIILPESPVKSNEDVSNICGQKAQMNELPTHRWQIDWMYEGSSDILASLGAIILWFCWFAFNSGSSGGISSSQMQITSSLAAVNTSISAAVSALCVCCLGYLTTGSYNNFSIANGVVSGLVAVTAPCDCVHPYSSLAIGLVAGIVQHFSSMLMIWLRIDDAVDAVAVHLGNGMWGVLAVGIFHYSDGIFVKDGKLLLVQFYCLLFIIAFTGAISFFVMRAMKYAEEAWGWAIWRQDFSQALVGFVEGDTQNELKLLEMFNRVVQGTRREEKMRKQSSVFKRNLIHQDSFIEDEIPLHHDRLANDTNASNVTANAEMDVEMQTLNISQQGHSPTDLEQSSSEVHHLESPALNRIITELRTPELNPNSSFRRSSLSGKDKNSAEQEMGDIAIRKQFQKQIMALKEQQSLLEMQFSNLFGISVVRTPSATNEFISGTMAEKKEDLQAESAQAAISSSLTSSQEAVVPSSLSPSITSPVATKADAELRTTNDGGVKPSCTLDSSTTSAVTAFETSTFTTQTIATSNVSTKSYVSDGTASTFKMHASPSKPSQRSVESVELKNSRDVAQFNQDDDLFFIDFGPSKPSKSAIKSTVSNKGFSSAPSAQCAKNMTLNARGEWEYTTEVGRRVSKDSQNARSLPASCTFQIASDMHIEFWQNEMYYPKSYLMRNSIQRIAPVLCLLGDIGCPAMSNSAYNDYVEYLNILADKFEVVLVLSGNHEYYNDEKNNQVMPVHMVQKMISDICDSHPRLYYMDQKVAIIDGLRFVCAPLWADINERAAPFVQNTLNDYKLIHVSPSPSSKMEEVVTRKLLVSDTKSWFESDLRFIQSQCKYSTGIGQPCVVLTHHAPLMEGTSNPQYDHSAISSAFASDLSYMFGFRKHSDYASLAAWCFGHTHFCTRTSFLGVQLLSNQYGYESVERGEYFDPTFSCTISCESLHK